MAEDSVDLYDKAVGYLQKGQVAEALQALEQSLMTDAKDAQTWRLYSVVLTALGREEDAAKAGEKAREFGLDPIESLVMQAASASMSGDRAAAICHYEDALEIDGSRYELWVSYALLLLEEDYPKDALEASAKAVALEDADAQAWYVRGRVLRVTGDGEAALPAYDKAVALDPELSPAWHERGMVLTEAGKHDEAIECFDRVLAIVPGEPAATQAKAVVEARRDP